MSGTLTQALRTTPRKKWVKRSLIALLIIILALLLGVGFYVWSIGHTWDSQTQKFDSITDSQDGLDNLKKSLGDPQQPPPSPGPKARTPNLSPVRKIRMVTASLTLLKAAKPGILLIAPAQTSCF